MAALAETQFPFQIVNDNIQQNIDAERARIEAAGAVGARDAAWFLEYKTIAQINDRMAAMIADRPDLVSQVDLGLTLQGRHIYGIRITGPGDGPKPAVFFDGVHHAREWIAAMVPMWIADRFVYGYDTDPYLRALVNGLEIYIVPVVNVDGYVYTWTNDRLWRKNRRQKARAVALEWTTTVTMTRAGPAWAPAATRATRPITARPRFPSPRPRRFETSCSRIPTSPQASAITASPSS